MDTNTPHGELLFHIFGALAQYERALTRERVIAGLAAAKRRGKRGGRPLAIEPEKPEAVLAALNAGTSKAAVCRTFDICRATSGTDPFATHDALLVFHIRKTELLTFGASRRGSNVKLLKCL
jgi:DNA invertase Pin-like site-specific DNA recombinase